MYGRADAILGSGRVVPQILLGKSGPGLALDETKSGR